MLQGGANRRGSGGPEGVLALLHWVGDEGLVVTSSVLPQRDVVVRRLPCSMVSGGRRGGV